MKDILHPIPGHKIIDFFKNDLNLDSPNSVGTIVQMFNYVFYYIGLFCVIIQAWMVAGKAIIILGYNNETDWFELFFHGPVAFIGHSQNLILLQLLKFPGRRTAMITTGLMSCGIFIYRLIGKYDMPAGYESVFINGLHRSIIWCLILLILAVLDKTIQAWMKKFGLWATWVVLTVSVIAYSMLYYGDLVRKEIVLCELFLMFSICRFFYRKITCLNNK